MKLTTKFINSLITWQSAGRRSIEIEIKPPEMRTYSDNLIYIWAYDYDQVFGKSIETLSDLPSTEEMQQAKQAEAKRTIKRLEKELKEARDKKEKIS